MRFRHERVYFVSVRPIGDGVRPKFRSDSLDKLHGVRVEDIDDSGLSDGHVEVVQP